MAHLTYLLDRVHDSTLLTGLKQSLQKGMQVKSQKAKGLSEQSPVPGTQWALHNYVSCSILLFPFASDSGSIQAPWGQRPHLLQESNPVLGLVQCGHALCLHQNLQVL